MNGRIETTIIYKFMYDIFIGNQSVPMKIRVLRHLIAGGAGTLIYMMVVAGCVEWIKLDPVLGVAISYVFLGVFLYWANRRWVYHSELEHKASIPRFIVMGAVSLLLNSGIMFIAVNVMGWWYIWGLFGSIIIVPPTNFIMNYYWAFK
jgi:putative flippase GtrA